jgi:starch synthase
VSGLAEALAEVASDPERRSRMGAASRERVMRLFAWPAIAQRTAAVYEEMLAPGRGPSS